jgi:hypothetical protein
LRMLNLTVDIFDLPNMAWIGEERLTGEAYVAGVATKATVATATAKRVRVFI